MQDVVRPAPSSRRFQGIPAGIFRLRTQFLLNAQKLIVFGSAVGTGERAGFDLSAIGRDREVGNCRVPRFRRNDAT